MNNPGLRLAGMAPTMWDFHWHEKRVSGFKTHTLAAYFSDKFSRNDKQPLILLMMHVQWRNAKWWMVTDWNNKSSQSPLGIR